MHCEQWPYMHVSDSKKSQGFSLWIFKPVLTRIIFSFLLLTCLYKWIQLNKGTQLWLTITSRIRYTLYLPQYHDLIKMYPTISYCIIPNCNVNIVVQVVKIIRWLKMRMCLNSCQFEEFVLRQSWLKIFAKTADISTI